MAETKLSNVLHQEILAALQSVISALEDADFLVWSQDFVTSNFGNFQLILFNDVLKLKILRDRNELFIEFSSENEKWQSLSLDQVKVLVARS